MDLHVIKILKLTFSLFITTTTQPKRVSADYCLCCNIDLTNATRVTGMVVEL